MRFATPPTKTPKGYRWDYYRQAFVRANGKKAKVVIQAFRPVPKIICEILEALENERIEIERFNHAKKVAKEVKL